MLICIDLSKTYFALKELGITINYDELLAVLKEKVNASGDKEVELEGFTVADYRNIGQRRFLSKIQEMGVKLHTWPHDSGPPNFSAEIAACAALSDHKEIVFVSNDSSLIRVFEILREKGKRPSLSFFSERLEGKWAPTIIKGEVDFVDLSAKDVMSRIVG